MPKDKKGDSITYREFFKRWRGGIKNVVSNPSPLEKINIELNGTFITLVGLVVCFIALIIFRDKFFVTWFAYGLLLIFAGNIVTTGLKFFGLKEQKRFLNELELQMESSDEELNKTEVKND